MRSEYQTRFILAGLLALALVVRLAAGWWWHERNEHQFGFGDSQSYWLLGQAIAKGEPYQHGSPDAKIFRTPGYPLLLAGLFRALGDSDPSKIWAHGLSAVLGTIGVACVYWLGRRVFDPRTGLVAAAIAAVYPGSVGMGVFILSEAAFCPLMLAQLATWVTAFQAKRPIRGVELAFLAGLIGGAATLVRPSWLLFTPIAAGIGLCFGSLRGRQFAQGLAAVAGLCLAMAPWWVRSHDITGRFVPTTLQVGASLYDGLNPNATGASRMDFVEKFKSEVWQTPAHPMGPPFEYRLNQRMYDAAVDWAMQNPGRAMQLAGIKFLRMWNVWPNEPEFRAWPLRLAVAATYVPLIVLALFGAWRFTRFGWPFVLCWIPAGYLTLLHVVFVGSLRYREPPMLALLVLAAAAMTVPRLAPMPLEAGD